MSKRRSKGAAVTEARTPTPPPLAQRANETNPRTAPVGQVAPETKRTRESAATPSTTSPATTTLLCAKCASGAVRQSRERHLQDYLILPFGNAPYRCRNCHSRFYAKAVKLPKERPHKRSIPLFERPSTKKLKVEILILSLSLLIFATFLYFLSKTGSQPTQ